MEVRSEETKRKDNKIQNFLQENLRRLAGTELGF
jgi:hypothetical protein